jgi:hydroxymethylbilane synthase
VLGLETRAQDFLTAELIRRAMHDAAEERRVAAERSFLLHMGGSCQTPLAAHAIDRAGGGMRIVGMCGMPDGSKILRAEIGGPVEDAELLGTRLADDLLAQGADAILAATKD